MKIVCIGRNYTDHIKELQNETPSEPVIFMKPDSALIRNNDPFMYPSHSKDVHFECELVLKINQSGKFIREEFAAKYYDEISLGIDFTARDVQSRLKEKGLPWELAKAFNGSAVIGQFVKKEELPAIDDIHFRLEVNGVTRQIGHTALMLTPIHRQICYSSQYFTWKKGDYLYTGTPAGVGPVQIGDNLKGYLTKADGSEAIVFDFVVR